MPTISERPVWNLILENKINFVEDAFPSLVAGIKHRDDKEKQEGEQDIGVAQEDCTDYSRSIERIKLRTFETYLNMYIFCAVL